MARTGRNGRVPLSSRKLEEGERVKLHHLLAEVHQEEGLRVGGHFVLLTAQDEHLPLSPLPQMPPLPLNPVHDSNKNNRERKSGALMSTPQRRTTLPRPLMPPMQIG